MSIETGMHYPINLDLLPHGWRVGYVGEFAEKIESGFASGEHNALGDGVPHLRPMNVSREGLLDFGAVKHVDPRTNGKRLHVGDVLFNNTNSAELVGKTAVVNQSGPLAFSNHMTRILFRSDVLPKFAAIQLHFLWMRGYFQYNCVKHVNQASVSSTSLARSVPFVWAPPEEQAALVAEFEKQFSRLDEAVANLKRVKANLKRYKAAVLKAAVEGRLVAKIMSETRPTAVAENLRPIGDAVASLGQGWSPKCEREAVTAGSDWAVITTTAIQPMEFLPYENKRLPANLSPRPKLALEIGDLLITRAGPRSRVGVACLVRATKARLILCDKAYRLRVRLDIADPAYLEIVLNSPDILDALDELKTGISDSGVNLTQKNFCEIAIPLPALIEQKRIVAEVERRLSLIRGVETQTDANLKRAERMRQAILQRAFLAA
ncbi:MAG: hypothetical protein ING66_12775 [Rhodocyclaceae bacterium]|nr:hypothetical protein [Rhodocyclaceae bacterium]MCA3061589.1 hypothetical protein [Rhodocyclaceae bacterium]MCA3084209.1 hypothetical protein [Rhodocyclaceae bacterium]